MGTGAVHSTTRDPQGLLNPCPNLSTKVRPPLNGDLKNMFFYEYNGSVIGGNHKY
jgi:hypothetical protein